MIQNDTIAKFKKQLLEEKTLLETELSELGVQSATNPADWVPTKPEGDEFGADRNDNADIIEDMQDNSAALKELESRLATVVTALTKIGEGIFGTCEVCGEEIEGDRLDANPAAPTCKKHMNA